jgi:OHCU decarboxylase
MRFASAQGFNSGDQFFAYLKDSFNALYREGENGTPKMMTIGLHCRLIGRPGRIESVRKFIEYAKAKADVWFARRIDIAEHWIENHPPMSQDIVPSKLDRDTFVQYYGGIFEHSPWIATCAYALELSPAHDTAIGLHAALCRIFRAASDEQLLDVLKAHPDLAGKLAAAKQLTAESTAEQASAGLDALTEDERKTFQALNTDYTTKFGFPFIIAVKGLTKDDILTTFQTRIQNTHDAELATACKQVERIALLRLMELLP